jgi:PAS domain S-box-containing protein
METDTMPDRDLFDRLDREIGRIDSAVARLQSELSIARGRAGPFFRSAPDPCVIANRQYFLQVNAAWERVFGRLNSEMIGRPWAEFLHPEDIARTAEMALVMASGRNAVGFVNRYMHKDGSWVEIEWSSTAWDEEGLTHAIARPTAHRKGRGRR